MKKTIKVIIAAGGTGGHLFPALSLAKGIKRQEAEAEFLFVGTGRPLEKIILKDRPQYQLNVSGIKGTGLLGKLKAFWQAFLAIIEARKIIKKFNPNLCFVAGGYVCGPIAIAAKLLKVPIVVHEQNSCPGITNKLLARIANLVLLGFEGAKNILKAKEIIVTGNPIREEIAKLNFLNRDFNKEKLTILLMGGSQGAQRLNTQVLKNLVELKKEGLNFTVIHQAGLNEVYEVSEEYKKHAIEAEVKSFFQDMAEIYKKADLGIFRAGALTLAEIAAAKLPAFLIPLPTAADNHQLINAMEFVNNKAAMLIEEKNLGTDLLKNEIKDVFINKNRLQELSNNISKMFKSNVEDKMAELCLNLIRGKKNDVS